ncbi:MULTISPECIES: hypothetical protein [Bacillaceae]|uniref:Uncharacterized protein n=1 Tax=Evansella alkalicola TaxID=745819 RepID=A0ABS6K0P0_9BACI|nr:MULTISPECIES: hypothetical protein [Bacillaceae]MBU9722925.1 hypothetical protein [Bacillus alkalicola]
MAHSIFELTEWLESQKGKTLLINKGELLTGKNKIFDNDQIKLSLTDMSVKNIERHDEDGYLADQELILYGDGTIMSDEGEFDLPQSVYEIPLVGSVHMEQEKGAVKVETEKAVYTIKNVH